MSQDIVVSDSVIDAISEMVDTISLYSEADFENAAIHYETAKLLIIEQMIPLVNEIINSEEMSEAEKYISLVSTMSYTSLENFFLQAELQKHRRSPVNKGKTP